MLLLLIHQNLKTRLLLLRQNLKTGLPLLTNLPKSGPRMLTANTKRNWKSLSLSTNSSSCARLSSFTKRCDRAACLKGFTKSRRSLPIPWGSLIIKPTFQPPTGIGTASFANSAARWGWGLCRAQMSSSAQDAASWKHWTAPTLMIKNSISAAMITRSLNQDAPIGNTASRTSWKNTRRSSQQTGISYPLKPLGTPMRSSRELKNICQSESQCRLWLTRYWAMLCSQQKRSTFCTTSGWECHKTLWLNIYVSGMKCFGISTLKRLRPNYQERNDPCASLDQTRGK